MQDDDTTRTEEGVWCRHCRTITSHVVQSRHAAIGILRIRRCKSCRKCFRTLETYYSAKYGNVVADYPAIAPRGDPGWQHRPKIRQSRS